MSEKKHSKVKELGVEAGGDPGIPYGPSQLPWGEQVPEGADVTAPQEDPLAVYPQVAPPDVSGEFPGIDYKIFEIPPTGLTDEQRTAGIKALKLFADTQHAHFMGFQANQDQKYSADLSWLMDMHCNNLGDPYQSGLFTLNAKFCERAVLDYFAALWNCPWPHHDGTAEETFPGRSWGYVLTMGCTEGNIYGLFNARDYLKGKMLIEDPESEAKINARLARGKEAPERRFMYANPLPREDSPNAYTPIVFYSEDVHYSVVKTVRVLELTTFYEEGTCKYPGQCPITENGAWPEEVPSYNIDKDNPDSGTVDVQALEKLVRFFLEEGYPVLVVLNMGTTWKGAYDDVPAVNQMLKDLGNDFPWLWDRTIHYDPEHPELIDSTARFLVARGWGPGCPLPCFYGDGLQPGANRQKSPGL